MKKNTWSQITYDISLEYKQKVSYCMYYSNLLLLMFGNLRVFTGKLLTSTGLHVQTLEYGTDEYKN